MPDPRTSGWPRIPNWLAVAFLALYVLMFVGGAVVRGMTHSLLWVAVVLVVALVAMVALAAFARRHTGMAWRALADGWTPGDPARPNRADVLGAAANIVGVITVVIGTLTAEGNLPALLVVGLAAAAPQVVLTALQRWGSRRARAALGAAKESADPASR